MKILLVIDSLGSGGAQKQIVVLSKYLKGAGYQVSIFYYQPLLFFHGILTNIGIPLYYFPKRDKLGISVMLSLHNCIKKLNPDLVISFLDTPNFYCAIYKAVFKRKLKLIVSERSFTLFNKYKFKSLIKITSHFIADYIITNSISEKNSWDKRFARFRNKTECIYNGIETNGIKIKNDFLLKYKLLCIGSINPFKNLMYTVDILNELHNNFDLKISITWVGQKLEYNKKIKNYYKLVNEKVLEYGLEKFWNWIPVTHEINEIMIRHDALLHLAYVEGLSNVICESLASGLPVLVSDILDHPFLVKDNYNGYLIPLGNSHLAAHMIFSFYTKSDKERQCLGRNGNFFVKEGLSIDKMIKGFLNSIQYVINK